MEPRPAADLAAARARMSWRWEDGLFALVGFAAPPEAADLAALGDGPGQLVREGGETSLLVPSARLEEVLARHPDARCERDLCWIRFEMPMTWELVGFLALVTGELAAAGVPLGAVCGYSRDHLFLARSYRDTAERVLARLFPDRDHGSQPE